MAEDLGLSCQGCVKVWSGGVVEYWSGGVMGKEDFSHPILQHSITPILRYWQDNGMDRI